MKTKRKPILTGDRIIDLAIGLILIILMIICLYPVWYVFAASFTSSSELIANRGFHLWPKNFTVGAYSLVFSNPKIMNSLIVSLKVLLVSLPINITMTLLCGYFMASRGMMWKKVIVFLIMFTMYFNGGIIPSYLNIRSLGLYDSFWALVLPGSVNVFNAIICKTAIESIPGSLIESAYIDGANDLHVLFQIVVPLIKPTLAVLLLYYGVAHWNAWFSASIYIKSTEKLPVQNILRSILLLDSKIDGADGQDVNAYAETIKYAAIVITTVPVLCIYPFLQKHFTKGIMVGAVKG